MFDYLFRTTLAIAKTIPEINNEPITSSGVRFPVIIKIKTYIGPLRSEINAAFGLSFQWKEHTTTGTIQSRTPAIVRITCIISLKK